MLGAVIAVAASVLLPSVALSAVGKCQRTLVAELGKLVDVRATTLRKCHEAVVKGKSAGPCPDQKATAKIGAAEAKLRSKVNKACGGADRNCGIGTDDESLAAMGWDIGACPGFAGGGCDAPIENCNDVVDCVQCVGGTAVDQALALAYDASGRQRAARFRNARSPSENSSCASSACARRPSSSASRRCSRGRRWARVPTPRRR